MRVVSTSQNAGVARYAARFPLHLDSAMPSLAFSPRTVTVAALLVLAAVDASAQFGGGMGGMGGGRRGSQMGSMGSGRPSSVQDGGSAPQSLTSQAADRLYDLRMRLLITPQQAPVWDAFSARVVAFASEMGREHLPQPEDSATVAMERRVTAMQNRFALLEQINDETKRLYAALSAEQQKVADQHLPPVVVGLESPQRRPRLPG